MCALNELFVGNVNRVDDNVVVAETPAELFHKKSLKLFVT